MPINLDIDVLRSFIAIAEHGSHAKAATEVNKTQSAISMQMKRLEDMIDRPVFTREGRQNKLTSDGERLLEYAMRLTRLNDETIRNFANPELTGIVRFGTPEDYAERFLPQILSQFSRTHPLIQVEVTCMDSKDLATAIGNGEIDLALVSRKNDKNSTLLRRESLIWVMSKRHDLLDSEVLPIAVSNINCPWRGLAVTALEKLDRPWRIAYGSTNVITIITTALAGLTIGVIPRLNMREGLRELGQAEGFPKIGQFDISLLRREGATAPVIHQLADYITASFNDNQQIIAAE